ncbi:MAG: SPOR domain-containing protein [Candidatus Omnitrophica bacterium]|nr:SPOR domain-containing protein [Candidatus Omnitrophota bacterium]
MDLKQWSKYSLVFLLLTAPAAYASTSSIMVDMESAILQSDYKTAEDVAQKALLEKPEKSVADKIQYELGLCYLRDGDYAKSVDILKKITATELDNDIRDKAYLALYDALYAQEDYEQALKTIKRLLWLSPKSDYLSLVYFKYARVSLKLAAWDVAREYLEKIIKDFPQSFEVDLAKQYLEEKRYFAIQVGSFKEQSRAEQFAGELKKKGQYAYVVEATDKQNNKFYRVRVGQFTRLDDAKKLKSELSQQGYTTQVYP